MIGMVNIPSSSPLELNEFNFNIPFGKIEISEKYRACMLNRQDNRIGYLPNGRKMSGNVVVQVIF